MFSGCYPVNLSRWLYGREPEAVSAVFEFDPHYEVDVTFNGILEFGAGHYGIANSGTKQARLSRYEVFGERGYAMVEPFLVADHGPMTVLVNIDGRVSEKQVPPANAYALQVDAFTACLRGERESLTPPEDAVHNMTVIEALYRSGRTGRQATLQQ